MTAQEADHQLPHEDPSELPPQQQSAELPQKRQSSVWDGHERRINVDRREKPTTFLDSILARGKRKRGRRKGEQQNSYVDVYQRSDVWLLVGVLLLNVCDALFTLIWLQEGGAEGNPIMKALIDQGNGVFLVQKCFVVGIWLIVLTVHKNFRIAKIGMWVLLGLYGALLVYHLFLQLSGVSPVIPH